MTLSKRILVTATLVAATAGGAASPALADNHITSGDSHVTSGDSHVTSGDSHVTSGDSHVTVTPQDSHVT
ncbi:hypothetical protein [Streptomyces sp. NPDC093109]|uniref:hypothetical protein n=1 Tax=Streptomyces sp. NPDC093109 TaxID=3154977 RepID=UPI00344C7D91